MRKTYPLPKTEKQPAHPFCWTKIRIDTLKSIAIGLPILLPLTVGVMWGIAVGMRD